MDTKIYKVKVEGFILGTFRPTTGPRSKVQLNDRQAETFLSEGRIELDEAATERAEASEDQSD